MKVAVRERRCFASIIEDDEDLYMKLCHGTLCRGTLFVLLAVLVSACTASRPFIAEEFQDWQTLSRPPASEIEYQVFLVGDAGGTDGESPLLAQLSGHLDRAGEQAAVVFLGDNIYCCGLPDSSNTSRPRAERRLTEQLEAVRAFPGRIVFTPGNHDWNNSKPGGLETLARQEKFVEEYLDRGNTFRPDKGFPGPDEIKLTDHITLVVVDTEWWLTPHQRGEGDNGSYEIEEEGDVLLALHEVIQDNDDEHVLVVGHHPLYSNGEHAGRFPLKTHLFPLTELSDRAYIPLPLLGSLVPLYIRYVGTRQDIAHRSYRGMRDGFLRAFGEHEALIYASGHEHSLQYFEGLHHDFIVSGTGSRPSYVARGGKAGFTYSDLGYSVLTYYDDGSVWMEMWVVDASDPNGSMVFAYPIKDPARDRVDPELSLESYIEYPDYSDSVAVVAANPDYQAGAVYKFFLGKQNRDVWAIPVEAPYLDLGREAGGLTPIKRGGGMQTYSLRLQGADGYEYSLRSVDKDPSVSIPEPLRETVATEIVQDQIASIHPFAAYIIPPLARAAGIYYTQPRLVYVPDDPRLGVYRELFGGELMMLELRPDDDMSEFDNFGNSKDVVSADKFYEEITEDNDHRPDQDAFVRARLFDMLLSDWDRHQYQWRWASFEPYELDPTLEGEARTKGKIYRPIPRDRDWAFNRFNGLLPSIMRIGVDPKFQEFNYAYDNVKGLTRNGLWQDRRLTATVHRETWIEIAEELKTRLTDDVIEEAILEWPRSIIDYHGDEVVARLKARRDQLPEAAEIYYELLARYVDLVGSHKHERFEVTRLNEEATLVVIYKTDKEGEILKELDRRMFFRSETSEIRLFGLDGNDQFVITGYAEQGIRIRAVGGAGHDTLIDESQIPTGGNKVVFYDTMAPTTIQPGLNTSVLRSPDPGINAYNQKEYLHNARLPQVFFGRNSDDGIFVGGGLKLVNHGFRRLPFQSEQLIVGNVAFRTGAFNILYRSQFTDAIGMFDVLTELNYRSPKNIRNFFGLGNETENEADDPFFYEAQFSTGKLSSALLLSDEFGNEFSAGAHLYYVDLRRDQLDLFIGQPGISTRSFRDQAFAGMHTEFIADITDHPVNPKQGFIWHNRAELNAGIADSKSIYAPMFSTFSFFVSPSLSPQVTFASRVGVEHRVGEFPFFDASTVGGRRSVRGWRSDRFAGRTSFFTNAELRLKLLDYSTYIALGELGVLGFFDNGRVWTEADPTPGKTWHQGYGGGIWFSLFDLAVINASVGFSEEDTIVDVKLGFLY